MFLQNNLKNQIALLCVTLIFICSSTIMVSFWWYSSRYNQQQIDIDIEHAQHVFEQYLSSKEELLNTATQVLTQDQRFQQAIAMADEATIKNALHNHGQRIGADLMLLTQINGELIISDPRGVAGSQELIQSVEGLLKTPGSARFIEVDDVLYQAILVPVTAPRNLGYTLVGFKIDRVVTNELRRLTGLEVSFLADDNKLLISSLAVPDEQTLQDVLTSKKEHLFFWQRPNYLSLSIALKSIEDNPIRIILTASLPKMYAEFDKVMQTTLLWATVTMAIGLAAALNLSRTLIVPIQQLVTTAKRFAIGDYHSDFDTNTSTSSEVCDLLDAFADMGRQIKAREEQVLFQARHDILTHLYNRNTMIEFISGQIHMQQPFLLVASNIRDFKSINDNLGPQIGDHCLRTTADRLLQTTTTTDSLHARLGGDEFMSLIPLVSLTDVDQITQDLLSLLHRPVIVHELNLKLRFCLGVCVFPDNGKEAKTLVRRAIIALEDARKQGVAVRHYQEGEDEAHLERLAIVDSLTKAMHANDGQLFMHYQPKLNIKSGRVDKVESLIRWQRPGDGWVSPELFIGLAEQAGLIVELTQWVVHTVLTQLQSWRSQGVDIKAAINISAQDLLHSDFVPFMENAVRQHGVPPNRITLELTERDLMSDEEQGLIVLTQLQAIGFTLSVDDYGIGQSSLGKLKKLPVSELKIDKSFILKLDSSPTDQMIVQSTIHLGHNLGLSVVAEGVENEPSLELLKKMGIDHIQGYLLSRPIAAADFMTWLSDHNTLSKHA